MKKRIPMALSALFLLFPAAASANSAQTYFEGVAPTGAMVTGEQSPIVVEKEVLTFDLQEFPLEYYREEADYLAYTGKVTAEYTFHNPADHDVTAKLAFPFGQTPDYGYSYETDTRVYGADAEKYDVLADGKPIARTVRHTLFYRGEDFALEKDLSRLIDGYMEDDFWKSDTPVTRYTYTIDGIAEEFEAARLGFRWSGDADKRKLMLMEQAGGENTEGSISVTRWVENGDTIELYVFGEPLVEELEWFSENGAEDTPFDHTLTLESIETSTFEEFVFTEYEDSAAISRSDWYNAVVTDLKNCEWEFGVLGSFEYGGHDISRDLLRWYGYEIAVPAGGTVVNTVTAPMYPAMDIDHEPPIYEYTYLLSPAQTWADFGTLEIAVNTPYHMIESGLEGFQRTEKGYAAVLDGLPEGELQFTLSADDRPRDTTGGYGSIALLGGGVLLGAVLAIKRRKSKEDK